MSAIIDKKSVAIVHVRACLLGCLCACACRCERDPKSTPAPLLLTIEKRICYATHEEMIQTSLDANGEVTSIFDGQSIKYQLDQSAMGNIRSIINQLEKSKVEGEYVEQTGLLNWAFYCEKKLLFGSHKTQTSVRISRTGTERTISESQCDLIISLEKKLGEVPKESRDAVAMMSWRVLAGADRQPMPDKELRSLFSNQRQNFLDLRDMFEHDKGLYRVGPGRINDYYFRNVWLYGSNWTEWLTEDEVLKKVGLLHERYYDYLKLLKSIGATEIRRDRYNCLYRNSIGIQFFEKGLVPAGITKSIVFGSPSKGATRYEYKIVDDTDAASALDKKKKACYYNQLEDGWYIERSQW